MKLIVGLGNPGLAYKNTRHNLGFMVADAILEDFKGSFKKDSVFNCFKAKLDFKDINFVLCKPLSYMNLSGKIITKLALKNKIAPQDILVICDDVNLKIGRIKIKPRGSSGGHKGIESIISSLGSQEFPRLRIGIDIPTDKEELSRFVLSGFSAAERKTISKSVLAAKEAALCWLENGINYAMNKFNQNGG